MATPRKAHKDQTRDLSGLPWIPYHRVSRIGGRKGDSYISIPEAERSIREVAQQHGLKLLPKLMLDEDYSGSNLDRPAFQKGLQMIRDGKAAGFVATRVDRFSRNTQDGLDLTEEIESYGGGLFTPAGRLSVANPNAKLIATVIFGQGDHELGTKKEEWSKAVRNAIQRGVHLAVPFGYRRSNGRGSPLEIDPAEAPTVERAFRLRCDGHGWATIARALNADGQLPREREVKDRGTREVTGTVQSRWSHKTIRQLITNPVYTGLAWNGEHQQPGAHPAIVSLKLWEDANRSRGMKTPRAKTGHLLTGLVRCASCGYAMVHSHTGERVNGKKLGYYVCRGKTLGHAGRWCEAPVTVSAAKLEAHVEGWFVGELERIRQLGAVRDDSGVRAAEAQVETCEHRLEEALAAKIGMGAMSAREKAIVEKMVSAGREALTNAELELRRQVLAANGSNVPVDLDAASYLEMPLERRRHSLSLVIAGVAVRRGRGYREDVGARALIVPRNDAPDDLISFFAGIFDR